MKLLLEADNDDLEKILKAERLLADAGIEFDAGMPIDSSPRVVREWFFDGIGSEYEVKNRSEIETTGEDIMEKVSKKTVKQIFEGFAEINDISKSKEERFKQLIDDAGEDE